MSAKKNGYGVYVETLDGVWFPILWASKADTAFDKAEALHAVLMGAGGVDEHMSAQVRRLGYDDRGKDE